MNKVFVTLDKLFGGGTIGKVVDRTLDRLIPDKTERLKLIAEIEKDLRDHSYNILKIEFEDLDSARKMQIEALKQDDLFSKRFIYYLTIILLSSAVLVSVLPFFLEYPKENLPIITRATDFLYMISGAQVIAFFFGKSTQKNNTNVQ